MTAPASPWRGDGRHDPACPKSFPTRVYPDPETGDPWTLGPTKLRCQCSQLAAAREAGLGGLDLHMAYLRRELGGDSAGSQPVAAGEAGRLRDLDRILALADRVVRRADVWDWLRAPNATLGGAAPIDVVAAGEHERVADLLTGLAEGVTD